MGNQHGSGCRADSGNNAPGVMKLSHRLDQQRAIAEALCTFNAAG